MNRFTTSRNHPLLVLAFLVTSGTIADSYAASPYVESIVVRFKSAPPKGDQSLVSKADLLRMDEVLGVQLTPTTRAIDGAVTLTLDPPLPRDTLLEGLQQLRQDPRVLYVEAPDAATLSAHSQSQVQAGGQDDRILNRIIVKYKHAQAVTQGGRFRANAADTHAVSLAMNQSVAQDKTLFNGAVLFRSFAKVSVPDGDAALEKLRQDPNVEYAEFDGWARPMATPTDPMYSQQWHYMGPPGGANLVNAWTLTTGSSSIRTAVLDTGSLVNHPDLAGRYIGGYDFVSDATHARDGDGRDPNPNDEGDWTDPGYCDASDTGGDSSWHGTHVAGTIGAATNNGIGVAGINWTSKVVPLRVLAACGGWNSDIADAIAWASGASIGGIPANAYPAQVINLSLGGKAPCSSTYQNAITTAINNNAVVVVSAGNSNADAIDYTPANCNGVITVASNGYSGERAYYSNYGSVVEITAPGGDTSYGSSYGVLSTLGIGPTTLTGYTYGFYQGTSMAAPHVSGIVSLMKSVNPALTPSQITSTLQTTVRAFPKGTARDCTTSLCGPGIIDATAALSAISPQPSVAEGIAGVNSAGAIWYNRDLKTWARATGVLNQVDAGSFSGLIGTNFAGDIWFTTDLTNWTKYSGTLTQVVSPDLNGDGTADVLGINSAGDVWYNLGYGWTKIPGANLRKIAAGDVNGDGHDDIVGLSSVGTVWYSTNLVNFTAISSTLSQVAVGDLNADRRADIVGIAPSGSIWYTVNLNTWYGVSGSLAQLDVGDLNGDGKGDIAGLNAAGSIWYTTDLRNWASIPGQLKQITVGRF